MHTYNIQAYTVHIHTYIYIYYNAYPFEAVAAAPQTALSLNCSAMRWSAGAWQSGPYGLLFFCSRELCYEVFILRL